MNTPKPIEEEQKIARNYKDIESKEYYEKQFSDEVFKLLKAKIAAYHALPKCVNTSNYEANLQLTKKRIIALNEILKETTKLKKQFKNSVHLIKHTLELEQLKNQLIAKKSYLVKILGIKKTVDTFLTHGQGELKSLHSYYLNERLEHLDPALRTELNKPFSEWLELCQKNPNETPPFWFWLENYKGDLGKSRQTIGQLVLFDAEGNAYAKPPIGDNTKKAYANADSFFPIKASDDKYTFNIDKQGRLYITPFAVKHSYVTNNLTLAAAGFIEFKNAKISHMNNSSGHYLPVRSNISNAVKLLEKYYGKDKNNPNKNIFKFTEFEMTEINPEKKNVEYNSFTRDNLDKNPVNPILNFDEFSAMLAYDKLTKNDKAHIILFVNVEDQEQRKKMTLAEFEEAFPDRINNYFLTKKQNRIFTQIKLLHKEKIVFSAHSTTYIGKYIHDKKNSFSENLTNSIKAIDKYLEKNPIPSLSEMLNTLKIYSEQFSKLQSNPINIIEFSQVFSGMFKCLELIYYSELNAKIKPILTDTYRQFSRSCLSEFCALVNNNELINLNLDIVKRLENEISHYHQFDADFKAQPITILRKGGVEQTPEKIQEEIGKLEDQVNQSKNENLADISIELNKDLADFIQFKPNSLKNNR